MSKNKQIVDNNLTCTSWGAEKLILRYYNNKNKLKLIKRLYNSLTISKIDKDLKMMEIMKIGIKRGEDNIEKYYR